MIELASLTHAAMIHRQTGYKVDVLTGQQYNTIIVHTLYAAPDLQALMKETLNQKLYKQPSGYGHPAPSIKRHFRQK